MPGIITGEASTGYICHPHAPKKIAQLIPKVKLIALLRNPVDRAYSHYLHTNRLGKETLSFEDAIAKEEERLRGIVARIHEDGNYYSPEYHYYSYLSRGIYIDQLEAWFSFFDKQQILILPSEELYRDPAATYSKVLEFLDLPNWKLEQYEIYNSGNYKSEKNEPFHDESPN
jgi:hypothetical protein